MPLPVGFRFNPREEELVGYYLYNKLFSRDSFKDSYVQELDLYGDVEPWQVWEQQGGYTNDNDAMYFFTRLKKASASRIRRRVGAGTWAGENTGARIKIPNNGVSGLKKRFRYENEGSEHDGAWIMYEYVIPGHEEMVLCCLKPNKRKMKKRVAVVADDDDEGFQNGFPKRRRTAALEQGESEQFLGFQESSIEEVDAQNLEGSEFYDSLTEENSSFKEWDRDDLIDLSVLLDSDPSRSEDLPKPMRTAASEHGDQSEVDNQNLDIQEVLAIIENGLLC